jgi:drug/metabolite transporter (DMT)-like permease
MTKKGIYADASMLMIAIIWGATFLMVKGAVENFPVFSFLAVRFAIASVALLLLTWRTLRTVPRKWVIAGLLTGLVNFAGFALQTYGLQTIAPGRAAFITGLYGALVPLMLVLIGKGKITRVMWMAIGLSVMGLMFLFWHDLTFNFSTGDLLVILCAFAFAIQIVMVGLFSKELDPRPMATLQALSCFGAALALAVVTDHPMPAIPLETLGAAAFTGVLGTALALLVQTWAQRHTPTSHAALILCTEPVWGAVASVTLFGEVFTPLATVGCVLMLISMVAPDLTGVVRTLHQRRMVEQATFGLPAR